MKKFTLLCLTHVYRHWFVVTVCLLLAITLASLMPMTQMANLSVPGSDKTHHFISYAALMFPTALRRPRFWGLIGLGFIAYSGLIELVQPFMGRSNEWLDLLANTGGVCLGGALGWIAQKQVTHFIRV